MALSASTVWEVRTAGSDSNGGGFVTGAAGTDYSQQDAAQYTFADLASTNGTTNPAVVSSASHNFVAADVGNIIQITAGTSWTAGFYQIVSVAGNAATLDRACGSAATLSSGTFAVGGALLTWAKAINNASLVGGQKIYIKSGTYTVTAVVALGASGDDTNGAISLIGYDAARGDNTGTRPILTSATNSVNLFSFAGKSRWNITNIKLTHTAATRGSGFCALTGTALYMSLSNFVVDGCLNGFFAGNVSSDFSMQASRIENFLIQNCTNDGMQLGSAGDPTVIRNGTIYNCTGNGYSGGASLASNFLDRVFISTCGGKGVTIANSGASSFRHVSIRNCAIYKNGGDGITSAITTAVGLGLELENNVIYGNGGWGVNLANASALLYANKNNAYGTNTSGDRTGLAAGSGDVTGIADPLTSATNPTLNAAGLTTCKAAGFPGAFISGGTGYLDIGPLQHQDAGGGAAGMLFVPNLDGV